MTTAIEHLSTLYYSPIVHEKLFLDFYSYIIPKEHDILLSYLVLPIYFHHKTYTFFNNAKKTSSLITLINKRDRLIGIENRITEFHGLTNRCMQRLIDGNAIIITKQMSIDVKIKSNTNKNNNSFIFNLAKILSQNEVDITYRLLGVNKI